MLLRYSARLSFSSTTFTFQFHHRVKYNIPIFCYRSYNRNPNAESLDKPMAHLMPYLLYFLISKSNELYDLPGIITKRLQSFWREDRMSSRPAFPREPTHFDSIHTSSEIPSPYENIFKLLV